MDHAFAAWVGENDSYPIPPEFSGIRITVKGMPDRRFRDAPRMIAHFARLDAEASERRKAMMDELRARRVKHGPDR